MQNRTAPVAPLPTLSIDPARPPRQVLHRIREAEDVGAARRAARGLSASMEAGATDIGRVELAVTELGTNLLRHTGRSGHLLLGPPPPGLGPGMDVVAVDRGPGIPEIQRAVLGRAAPAPSPPDAGLGVGLDSVKRLASTFDLFTVQGQGTAILARFQFGPPSPPQALRVGAVSIPVLGEEECGDAWAVVWRGPRCWALVVDGLGHGREAARAADAAVQVFRQIEEQTPELLVFEMHQAMRATRGGVLSVCCIDTDRDRMSFLGVGNVEARLIRASESVGMTPRNGTVGSQPQLPTLHVRELEWTPGAIIVLHSDGIRSHLDLGARGGLAERDPMIIAAVLHRDLERGMDDATVLVLKDARPIRRPT